MPIQVLITPSPQLNRSVRNQIRAAIRAIARDYTWTSGQISVALLDDPGIQEINRTYLQHDYPTDVISFDLTDSDDQLEGEILISWETAARVAQQRGWSTHQEMLLYIIHGMLHIVGLLDDTPAHTHRMRREERHYMRAITGDDTQC